jgi:1-acyl-sn-glycerol-3-phosphate acyltransferase
MRWFWQWYLRRNGWTIEGHFPYHLKKMVIAVAPHTHWLDFVVGLAVRSVIRITHVRFLGKEELFRPPFGFVFRWLGGTPVNRSRHTNLVDAVVSRFNQTDALVIALSPEGTRKKVDKLRTGFYHIARQAQVPILLAALDFYHRKVIFSAPFYTTQNEAADLEQMLLFFSGIKGKIPDQGLLHFATPQPDQNCPAPK